MAYLSEYFMTTSLQPKLLFEISQDKSTNLIHTYADIKQIYKEKNCWGILSSLDLKKCDPALIRSSQAIEKYVIELCKLIDVKRFQETKIVHFGEDEKIAGYSMVQLIETSLVSGHFANLTNSIYMDIFSCKLYDPFLASQFSKDFFKAQDVSVSLCFRV